MKILIVDNRPVFRTGIRYILKKQFSSPEFMEADTLAAFCDACPDDVPDMAILGQDACSQLHDFQSIGHFRKSYPGTGLIVLYKSWDIESIRQSFEAGADGYLFENTSSEEWTECTGKVAAGRKYVPGIVLEEILNHHLRKEYMTLAKDMLLSNRQLEVARLLNRGMTISGIAGSLGKKVSSISTIKARMFKKLNISSLVELKEALEVYENGLSAPGCAEDIPDNPHG